MEYYSMTDIRRANERAGFHWFEPSTLRFFRSRVGSNVYQGPGGVYFTSSEQGPSGVRAYSVRKFNPETGDIDTVGEFQQYASASGAIAAAKRAAKGE